MFVGFAHILVWSWCMLSLLSDPEKEGSILATVAECSRIF